VVSYSPRECSPKYGFEGCVVRVAVVLLITGVFPFGVMLIDDLGVRLGCGRGMKVEVVECDPLGCKRDGSDGVSLGRVAEKDSRCLTDGRRGQTLGGVGATFGGRGGKRVNGIRRDGGETEVRVGGDHPCPKGSNRKHRGGDRLSISEYSVVVTKYMSDLF
jgi:hypothetical protein